jgi:hypothetical protein
MCQKPLYLTPNLSMVWWNGEVTRPELARLLILSHALWPPQWRTGLLPLPVGLSRQG